MSYRTWFAFLPLAAVFFYADNKRKLRRTKRYQWWQATLPPTPLPFLSPSRRATTNKRKQERRKEQSFWLRYIYCLRAFASKTEEKVFLVSEWVEDFPKKNPLAQFSDLLQGRTLLQEITASTFPIQLGSKTKTIPDWQSCESTWLK